MTGNDNSVIAPAARLAGVHRATVFRWLSDEAFADAMQSADDDFYRANGAKVLAEQAARRRWREERERARRLMRRRCLAIARAAKRREAVTSPSIGAPDRKPERPATHGYTPTPPEDR